MEDQGGSQHATNGQSVSGATSTIAHVQSPAIGQQDTAHPSSEAPNNGAGGSVLWPKNLGEPAEFESLLSRTRDAVAKMTDDRDNAKKSLLFCKS